MRSVYLVCQQTKISQRCWLLWSGLIAGSLLLLGCQPRSMGSNYRSGSPQDRVAKAQQILHEGLNSPAPPIRSNAIEVVAATQQIQLLPIVRRLMRDPIVPVRFSALLAMGDLRWGPAQADLHQIFDEEQEDTNVRMAAAYALVRLGQHHYAEFYIKQIRNADQTIRANAALIIGKGRNIQALPELYWALQDSQSDDRVLIQAAESIAQLGDAGIIEKLWTRLISAYADDRIDGIRAMGALGTEQARQAIATMLDDEVIEVQLAAAEQLGRLGDSSGEPQVLAALQGLKRAPGSDPAERLRIKALCANAIGAIGAESLTRYLPPLLEDESSVIQIATARASLETAPQMAPLVR
ncbi:HEAT repeat domain-containing protein [Planctomycetota bacterium]